MKNLILPTWLSFVIVFEIFVLIPLTIYLGNINEFSSAFLPLISIYVIPAVIILVIFLVLYLILSKNDRDKYIVLLSAFAFLIWVQSFILVWDYGALDGSIINWRLSSYRSWFDFLIWVVVISLALIFHKKLRPNSWKLVSGIILLQSVLTFYHYSGVNDVKKISANTKNREQIKTQIYRFSPKQNILHLMLDGFQNDVFNDLINNPDYGEKYKNVFEGFVYFDETMSVFPYTRFSIPSFISGQIYQNNIPKDQFINAVFKNDNIFNTAHDSGFELDYVTDEFFAQYHAEAKHNNILTHSYSSNDFQFTNATQLLDLSLFRLVPHVIKKYIYNDQKWLLSYFFSEDELTQYKYFSNSYFMNDLVNNMTTDRETSVYKYIHLFNTHNPMVTAPDCSFAGGVLPTSRRTLTIQSKCTLDIVTKLFKKMKELDIYDNTLIVMHADHGGWVTPTNYKKDIVNSSLDEALPHAVPGLASPLLAIKPIGSNGSLKVSSSLISLSDIPDTISSLMRWDKSFGGKSAFDMLEDSSRERSFYYYAWQRNAWTTDYLGPLYHYTVNGSHYRTPWVLKNTILPPKNLDIDPQKTPADE